jgi:hypothetical protein
MRSIVIRASGRARCLQRGPNSATAVDRRIGKRSARGAIAGPLRRPKRGLTPRFSLPRSSTICAVPVPRPSPGSASIPSPSTSCSRTSRPSSAASPPSTSALRFRRGAGQGFGCVGGACGSLNRLIDKRASVRSWRSAPRGAAGSTRSSRAASRNPLADRPARPQLTIAEKCAHIGASSGGIVAQAEPRDEPRQGCCAARTRGLGATARRRP